MATRKLTLEERFWSKVDKSGDCWLWTGCRNEQGYGLFDRTRAHRVAFEWARGHKPLAWVLHRCDNPQCVNPDHLFEGTARDNNRDMCAKGRGQSQQKTHCPSGHPYSSENTYPKASHDGVSLTWRYCRACNREQAKRLYDKQRLAGTLRKRVWINGKRQPAPPVPREQEPT